MSDPHRLSMSIVFLLFVFLQDIFAGNDAFQAPEIGAMDYRHQRHVVHVAERRFQGQIGMKIG